MESISHSMPLNSPFPKEKLSPKFYFPRPRVCAAAPYSVRNLRTALGVSPSSSTKNAQNPATEQHSIIVIPNKHGEKLVGFLHETGSKEVIILCHGFRSSKETKIVFNLAAALEKEGIRISSFRFDFAGNGESQGIFHYANYWREADDLHAIVQNFHGANRVIGAILGYSKGGNVVLLYASKYHNVGMVVNVSGRYNMERGIEERLGTGFMQRIVENGFIDVMNKKGEVIYRVTKENLMDRLNTKMHEACLEIGKRCRVLTVHGSADEIIPVEDALEFANIIPNHTLNIIEGADHSYTCHQVELASVVVNYIKTYLQNS